MKLTKDQALDLIKILSHYETFDARVNTADLSGLCCDLETFVLSGDTDEEEDEDSEEDEDLDEEEDDEKPNEQEDEEDDESSEESEEDDGESEEDDIECDSYCYGSDLSTLKQAKARVVSSSFGDQDDEVTIKFEEDDEDCALVVSINGSTSHQTYYSPVTHVKRTGTEVHVAVADHDDRTSHRLGVTRFPKGWSTELPVGDLVGIET